MQAPLSPGQASPNSQLDPLFALDMLGDRSPCFSSLSDLDLWERWFGVNGQDGRNRDWLDLGSQVLNSVFSMQERRWLIDGTVKSRATTSSNLASPLGLVSGQALGRVAGQGSDFRKRLTL